MPNYDYVYPDDKCDEGIGEGFRVYFWTDGALEDAFNAYTNANGQIIHNFTIYCSQRYFLTFPDLECTFPCENQFVPINSGNFSTPYECDNVKHELCYCKVDSRTNKLAHIDEKVPTKYFLYQNYPNPFNPFTDIRFDMPKGGYTKLTVYDLAGNEVITLINGLYTEGTHDIEFDGSNFASGAYIYKLESNEYVKVMKMILMK